MGSRSSPLVPNSQVNWKHLWKLKVPAKVRNFIWRVCSKCLPTRLALLSRHVDVPLTCPVCNLEPESDYHALIACPKAKKVWPLTSIGDLSALFGNIVD